MTWKLRGKLISLTLLFVPQNLIIALPVGIVITILLNNYNNIWFCLFVFKTYRRQKPYTNYFQRSFYELLLPITF